MPEETTESSTQLRNVIERIERLEGEKAALASDIKDIYAEAKANGFSPKALREVVRDRKRDAAAREDLALAEAYLAALGSGTA